ncbi:Lytic transglycosylase catalytic [Leptothrix cholodnii SP-6]|uniref:Lytic transglycosylase catalytic n=1 Tax=Leptothrix cholodnii (strain ATCC 51168 / LMG 8142 / SP-6) TaxID=395495 RepID=B1Y639_LEPCP|nr:lytic transglycosylase domain-containing protein [Leptothrix cholodnii]ACB32386.1 Lytic transglycosylase catalytic [Leptothrix cholodnii SP-6]
MKYLVSLFLGSCALLSPCAAQSPQAVDTAAPALVAEPIAPTGAAALAIRPIDQRLLDAREALRSRDRARLASARDALVAARHPLAMWADYWEIGLRLGEVGQDDLEAFYARWPGTYVEDRLRNDWLLELGIRRDWARFGAELPRFRMADDRQVNCYAMLLRHQAGDDVRASARSSWLGQREPAAGCALMAGTLFEARRLSSADVWLKARISAEAGRPKLAREALALISETLADKPLTELWDQPLRYFNKHADAGHRQGAEMVVLALVRLATSDPQTAATLLEDRWQAQLAPDAAAWTWAAIAKQAAWKRLPEADGWFQRALTVPQARDVDWSDDTLAWRARAALRATDAQRWERVLSAINAMTAPAQADPTWVYWKGRALMATAAAGTDGDARRTGAAVLFERIAGGYNFYGKLAADALGRTQSLPPRPAALGADERRAAEQNPGLNRALMLIGLGLRSEGVREWNFSVIGMNDRALLAAAQRACEREIWDRCIHTSERTRTEVDMAQRFPTPFRAEVVAAAQEVGLDAAYIYGLIRQESRFITDVRSSAGAAGLMQLMPGTARWTARKLGVPYTADRITDRNLNLRLGAGYLKLVLDDFEGSQALATAAYNAGPSRSRRWREGPPIEVAAWAESIPFNETRDYVKKVLSNASYYAALLGGQSVVNLKQRLGPPVTPRAETALTENRDLP